MDWMLQGVVALAIGLAALASLVLGLTAFRLRRLALRRQTVTVVAPEAVPADWRQRLDAARPVLTELGFHHRCTLAMPPAAVAEGEAPIYLDQYEHDDARAQATVWIANPPVPHRPCNISFGTLLADGRLLTTSNGTRHHLPVTMERMVFQDGYFPTTQAAWALHQQRLQGVAGQIVSDPRAFFRANQQAVERVLPEGERRGQVVRQGDHWVLSWRRALVFAAQWYWGERKVSRMGGAPGTATASVGGASAEAAPDAAQAEIAAFHKHLAVQRGFKLSRSGKWKLFAVSAALFLLVGSLWISWTFLPILLAVIALHEAGHFLAMRLSGYGNLSVFFVPGLGGMASGEKPDAGPWHKLFVYLAGPMPGIVLAVAGLAAMLAGGFQPPRWFLEFLLASLVINYLNLLPVVPLDGGRVVETFVFARYPRARFAFTALGVAALAGVGLALADTVLLVVAVLVSFSLPQQWRMARVDSTIVRGPEDRLDEGGAITRIFSALQQPRFGHWTFQQRAAVASALLPELQGRHPRPREVVAGLAIYALCLIAPLAVGVASYQAQVGALFGWAGASWRAVPDDVDPGPPAAAPAPERDWMAEAAQWQRAPEAQQLPLLLRAAEQADERNDNAARTRWLKDAEALAAQRPAGDLDRVRALSTVADEEADAQGSQRIRRQLVAELSGNDSTDALALLADLKTRLSDGDDLDGAERLRLLREALAHREQARQPWQDLGLARRLLAQALDRERQPAQAEALLRQNVEAVPAVPEADRTREGLALRTHRVQAQVDLAWFLLAHARPADAGAAATQALARVPERISISWDQPHRMASEALVWVHLSAGDAAALRTAWRRYEDSRQSMGLTTRSSLVHEVDRLLVAQALRDAGLEAQAREGIRTARASAQASHQVQALCGQPAGREAWRTQHQFAFRRDAARAAGVCPPA